MASRAVARADSLRRARLELVMRVARRLVSTGKNALYWRGRIKACEVRIAALPADEPSARQVQKRGSKAKALSDRGRQLRVRRGVALQAAKQASRPAKLR